MSTNSEKTAETIRKILFGNLEQWKQALQEKTGSDLKKFIISELQRCEEQIVTTIALEHEKHELRTKHLTTITEKYLQTLAMLDTLSELPSSLLNSSAFISLNSSAKTPSEVKP